MKKLMIASALAMCLSANAFAEDDGYGNDIPPARQEGTVDDGYGNKLPEYGKSEYKSFEEARSSSGSRSTAQVRIGGHLGIGLGSYWDYPSEMGDNDWLGVTMDLGGVLKYQINSLVSVVPELNLGFNVTTREIARGNSWWYGDYRVEETRLLFNINIPLTLRISPIPAFYVEAGGRISFNLGTDHTRDYYDENNEKIEVPESYSKLEKWKVSTFVPSVVAGLGASIAQFDVGARLVLDLGGIEKDSKWITPDGDTVFENNTKNWTIQLLMNYYFN